MNGMSPEANQILNAGRQAFRPTESDRARLMAAITGTATLAMGAALTATAQRSLSSVLGLTHAARMVAFALPVAAAGGFWLHARNPPPAPPQPSSIVHQASVTAKPKLPEPPAPIAEAQIAELPSDTSEPSAPTSQERSAPPAADSSKRGNEIRREVALLSKAQAALSRGRPQEALEALTEHAQRFPRGVLSEERAATRVRTLCALGRTREAALELKRIETLNPSSAYLARARESCGF